MLRMDLELKDEWNVEEMNTHHKRTRGSWRNVRCNERFTDDNINNRVNSRGKGFGRGGRFNSERLHPEYQRQQSSVDHSISRNVIYI